MKAYNKLNELVQNLLKAENVEDKTKAEEALRAFVDYKNYGNRRVDIEDAVKSLSDAVNIMGGDKTKEFVDNMSHEHRTLQQGMTRLFLGWIKHLGELKDNWFDGRNEASVMVSRDIVSYLKFLNQLKAYHTMSNQEKDSQIKYIEEHKAELEEFVAFVRGFVLNEDSYIANLPCI